MAIFPTLYKKTSTGALQYWNICTAHNTITTRYGQVGGTEQCTQDVISEGKNVGRSNQTTVYQQADAEAQSKWEKQIARKGYVEDQARAARGETDAEGGIAPMLAKKFFKQESGLTQLEDGGKIKFPALFQPKLDGIRCIAVVEDGECTLWSRTRKLITSVPHINRAYEKHFGKRNVILDGELYSAQYADNFEHITHIVRQDTPCEGHEVVEHWVYDMPSHEGTNVDRARAIQAENFALPLVTVETLEVASIDRMLESFRIYRDQGFEGGIVRNRHGKYENKRSQHLQKVVEHITEEFPIMSIEEGNGRLQGHVGSFVLQAKNGQQFKAKLDGATERLREYFLDPVLWVGKQMTVRYRTLTRKNHVPRFPVALSVRDYE